MHWLILLLIVIVFIVVVMKCKKQQEVPVAPVPPIVQPQVDIVVDQDGNAVPVVIDANGQAIPVEVDENGIIVDSQYPTGQDASQILTQPVVNVDKEQKGKATMIVLSVAGGVVGLIILIGVMIAVGTMIYKKVKQQKK